jgi:Glycosyl transferase family 2
VDGIVNRVVHQPRITVVTPSYNQAPFLEACLRSVLGQKYPNLEYIVIDGGSTDGSVDIIRSFEKELAYWISEPDGGQYDALNKGFRRATGEILAWLNSDDMYAPWTLGVVGSIFEALPAVAWISTLYPLFWDDSDLPLYCTRYPGFDRWHVLSRGLGVQQESTFWRRSLWEQAGARLDTTFQLAADLDLWARFWEHAVLYGVTVPLGGMRVHQGQRHVLHQQQYTSEAQAIFERYYLPPYGRTMEMLMKMYWLLPRRLRRLLMRFDVPYHPDRQVRTRIIATVGKETGSWMASVGQSEEADALNR